MKVNKSLLKMLIFTAILVIVLSIGVSAEPPLPIPKIGLEIDTADNPEDVALSIQILFLLTILSLAPALLVMVTSFTRVIIVLSFTRNALGTQQMPPNQVLIGLALFITFFIMNPVITDINTNAFQPYTQGEITQEQAITKAMDPIRNFMLKNVKEKDLALFLNLSETEQPVKSSDIPTSALIPAFIISELKTAFIIGFYLYIPFIMIDMVVSSTLMSMGMMMLPPVMISLPFKLLLFVMVDGWNLIVKSLVMSFN
ncbi:MAG TPA: flagellar type III secretion system pore protein FliP [Patescibacteria group bacterium]|nr:flagellar type III secretion system pore protein FliP [Patescibacteria group bacterium]